MMFFATCSCSEITEGRRKFGWKNVEYEDNKSVAAIKGFNYAVGEACRQCYMVSIMMFLIQLLVDMAHLDFTWIV